MSRRFGVRDSKLGRIVVPNMLPDGVFLFYTTVDFDGRLNEQSVASIVGLIREEGGRNATLATCHQVHGTRAIRIGTPRETWCENESCDALFTRVKDVALGIKVADCLPVTLVEPSLNWTANIHAGWRGASARVVESTIASVRGDDRITSAAVAVLGPSIRQCCFEVGDEVVEQFRQSYPAVDHFVDRSLGRPRISITGMVTDALLSEGFAADNVIDSGLCTRCDDSIFHSYRRDGKNAGRNLAIVVR